MITVRIKDSWEDVGQKVDFTNCQDEDFLQNIESKKVSIEIEDNCWNGEQIREALVEPLIDFSNFKLQELAEDKDYSNLLVFSDAKRKNESHLLDLPVFSHSIIDEDTVRIMTGNVMGYIGAGNVQMKIRSRFDNGGHDFFLHYMLEKVFHVNLINLPHGNAGARILDILYLMFPYFLKKAVKQGILRQYVNKSCNDSTLKGTIDIPRHIRQNIPFLGKVAYTSHEYSIDNSLTQLVRHTIEHIRNRPIGKAILHDGENRKAVQEIVYATPSYNAEERSKIIRINNRPVAHPYYTEYGELKKICLQILTHSKMSYKEGKPTIHGILFDGAWLWEEYVHTILTDFEHPRNDKGEGGIRLFAADEDENEAFTRSRRKIYPDFYKKDENGTYQCILDAKYKKQDEKGICREDLYQVISYMHTTECKLGGYIYPYQPKDNVTPYREYSLAGLGGTVFSFPVIIPQSEKYEDFRKSMEGIEDKIRELISGIPYNKNKGEIDNYVKDIPITESI